MDASQITALIIAILSLFISAFISGSEIAFFSLTPAQIDDGDPRPADKKIRRLLSQPDRLLATILISNNLVNVTIVVLTNFALGPIFKGMNSLLSFILQTVILTFLILLFGEISPKIFANTNPLKWARRAAGPLAILASLLKPFTRILVHSTSFVRGVVTAKTHAISADELSQALEITNISEGEGTDKKMLEEILRFGQTTASEIMTPRIDITDIDTADTFSEVLKTVTESGFSRLPAVQGSRDNIKGILYSRDLLPYIGREDDTFQWQTLLREPYYVPESRQIDDLLEDFRRRRIHLAVVVDEFGGTQGLVTMEDVLEEIVGDINDEYDPEDKTYRQLRQGTYEFEGRTLLTDFFRITGLDPEQYEPVAEDAETLAGMLLAIKGDFPKEKEPLAYGACRFLVLDIEGHRITRIRVKVITEPETKPSKQ